MSTVDHRELFRRALEHASSYRDGLAERKPGPQVGPAELERLFDGLTPERPDDPLAVLDALALAAEAGITSPSSPGFFGWVMGGSHPVGVAADMMASAWGQNVASYACSPAGATAEKVAGRWLVDLLGLPQEASVGFVTGATMAAFTCLATARGELLARHGWDVERDGLFGAPRIRVFAGDAVHATNLSALRYLGLGSGICAIRTEADDAGRNTRAVISQLRTDDRFLALGADWKGRQVLRISVISPASDTATIDRLAAAIIAAWRSVKQPR